MCFNTPLFIILNYEFSIISNIIHPGMYGIMYLHLKILPWLIFMKEETSAMRAPYWCQTSGIEHN